MYTHYSTVAIRVDASTYVGTGHVMRCLTLAQELLQKGAQVVFVCREHPGNLCDFIESHGFEVHSLGFGNKSERRISSQPQPAHLPWLATDQDSDAEQTTQALQIDAPWDWLMVDHYALDNQWESALRQVANKIMVIDDIADRKHDCDLLLDQNYFQEPGRRYGGLIPKHCELLLGPKYALLRAEFREARKFCCMRGNGIARILVYFGGNDPDNLTGMALEALNSPELEHLFVEAVIGPNNQHQEQLAKQAKSRLGTRLHIQPEHFTELMLRADLCIGAGGTTTWERFCLNLPSLVITVAENQEPFTAELHNDGLITWIGRKQEVSVSGIKNSLLFEMENLQTHKLFSNSPNPVDGLGALRVAEKIIPSTQDELSLRQICKEDIELFYFWANDPVVRENSFQQEYISWENHISWFNNKLNSSYNFIWVLQTPHGLPVGQVRFDIQGNVTDIDYSLDPLVRGRGWGETLLRLGVCEFKKKYPHLLCQGRVKASNLSSIRCFERLGFIEKSNHQEKVFYWP